MKKKINYFAGFLLVLGGLFATNFFGGFFQEKISIQTIILSGLGAILFVLISVLIFNRKSKPNYTIKRLK